MCFFVCLGFLKRLLKVTLHETIRYDDFWRNTALRSWNNVVTIRNNVATLCCAKNRRYVQKVAKVEGCESIH